MSETDPPTVRSIDTGLSVDRRRETKGELFLASAFLWVVAIAGLAGALAAGLSGPSVAAVGAVSAILAGLSGTAGTKARYHEEIYGRDE